MDKEKLTQFLADARFHTYASNKGKVEKPAFPDMFQLEFSEGDWLYRDLYNNGSGKFAGLETIYYKNKPVWSMSYFGDYTKMTEEEIDKVLRKALTEHCKTTRLWTPLKDQYGEYIYSCQANGSSIEQIGGRESVMKDEKELYFFFYAGGIVAS